MCGVKGQATDERDGRSDDRSVRCGDNAHLAGSTVGPSDHTSQRHNQGSSDEQATPDSDDARRQDGGYALGRYDVLSNLDRPARIRFGPELAKDLRHDIKSRVAELRRRPGVTQPVRTFEEETRASVLHVHAPAKPETALR